MTLGLKNYIHVVLNLFMMFFFILFNINPCPPNQQMGFVWSTMIFKTILTLFLFFLKVILKGLKQPTSKAYKAWEM
jgi:hypothetical protein